RRPVEASVIAGVDERPRLLLLSHLAVDELDDVRVVDVQDHHLRRTACLAARLDHAGPGIRRLHEGYRTGRRAPAADALLRRAAGRKVHAGARAAFEDDPLAPIPVEIDSIVSFTERMKQAEHCGFGSTPTLNQTGLLNAAIW